MHIRDTKKQLRLAIEERLAHLSPADREKESRSLCRRVLERIPNSSIVCAYWPLKTEANIRPLIEELLKTGHDVYLPCFEGKLLFRKCTEVQTLTKGELGIMEPSRDAVELNRNAENVIVLVPARGYDRSCNRLGRGNGGYDIWIAEQRTRNPSTAFWGIALECQMVNEVPMEEHDQYVDAVVTARGWIDTT